MKNLLYLLFLLTSISYSQGSEVKVHNQATNRERYEAKIWQQIDSKKELLWKDIDASGIKGMIAKPQCYDIEHCNRELKIIEKRKAAIQSIHYLAKATELDDLYEQLGKEGDFVKAYKSEWHKYDNAKRTMLETLNKFQGKKDEIINEKKSTQKDQVALEKELAELNQISDLSKDLKKVKSLDDFLSDNNLMTDSTKNNEDFLSDDQDENSSDFLSNEEKVRTENFKILYKNGKEGVEDENGKILIPYKNYNILEYSAGVAKISIVIERITINPPRYNHNINGYAIVKKEGFIDDSGEFLETPTFTISSSPPKYSGFYLENDWSEEKERTWERRKSTYYSKLVREAENKLINKYNIK